MKKKVLTLIMAAVLIIGCSVGGTLAWLTAKTPEVTNTFTLGKVGITLEETTGDSYKMVPGQPISKDPVVTVSADSENCWLFVKVQEINNSKPFVTYQPASGWTELEATGLQNTKVFYRKVSASDSEQQFSVFDKDQVNVPDSITKEDFNSDSKPALVITAYAVQSDGSDSATAAWTKVSK